MAIGAGDIVVIMLVLLCLLHGLAITPRNRLPQNAAPVIQRERF